jgi:hypothetical protein
MRRWQALISLALAAAVAAATLGIAPTPASLWKVFGLAGEPFPCQDHACGCSSAADCFDGCCCFSPAELAAWRGARGEPADAPAPESEDHCDLCEAAAPAAPVPAPVALISALTCRAVSLSIAWAPPLLAAPAPIVLPVECAIPALLRPGADRAPAALARDVPTPPPRV